MGTSIRPREKDPFRWIMLLFVCLFYFVILGFCNQSFNVLLRVITEDMGWEATQRTAVATAMSSGMVWFVFIAGAMLDKISPKKVMISATLICAVLIFLRGQAQGFMFFFGIMFLFGVASAFYMPATIKIITLWFGADELAIANGCLTAASPMGQILANFFIAPIIAFLGGWRTLYMLIGVIVAVLCVAFFFFGKERKSSEGALSSQTVGEQDVGFFKNLIAIMKVPYVWCMFLANMLFLGMIYAIGSYAQFILQTSPNWMLDISVSGRIPAANNFFSMISYIVTPILIRKLGLQKNYAKIAIACGIIAPLLAMFGYNSLNFRTVIIVQMLAGILYGAIVPAPKVLMLQHPEVSSMRSGTAMGLHSTIERIGVMVFTGIAGSLVAAYPNNMNNVIIGLYAVQLLAPVLIFIGILFRKGELKKAEAAALNV